MPPIGGGLMQLVAYGAQDIYLKNNDYGKDDCMDYSDTSERQYNNFIVIERRFYKNGNMSFTDNKYNEYSKQFKNTKFIKFKTNYEYGYTFEYGNYSLQLALVEQKDLANKLREKQQQKTKTKLVW
jgi:hypothetical protein